ncbi:thiamine phosphate synthase [Sneathiella marina]|uniref:Thiamine-phosphate synthase n=1 Tax=Sneathiella marina TaxID=2950108 RepID=A0ABY4W7A0_9PROT|nr:thiamine phosphate synthase [Sneathiella marina]USG62684.1 thiamine phosphate synthase [Sneathiella marina]
MPLATVNITREWNRSTSMQGQELPERIPTRLYLISPAEIDLDSFETAFKEALEGGDVACFQLRLKDRPRDEIVTAAKRLMPLAQAANVAFLLNDDPQLARELGADGVHIGQDDMPFKAAREIVGANAIVGVTCKNSKHLAMQAAENGADYVAFGAFFPSTTKDETTRADVDILSWCSGLIETPCVAIGGITVENAPALVKNGADFLSVSAGVWNYKAGPKQAVRDFNRMIDKVIATC